MLNMTKPSMSLGESQLNIYLLDLIYPLLFDLKDNVEQFQTNTIKTICLKFLNNEVIR